MDTLIRDHLDSEKLGCSVCESLAYARRENDLRQLMESSPHVIVRAFACYELAGYLKKQVETNPAGRERLEAQIEALFEQVADSYADVEHPFWKRPLGDLASAELFEIRHLIVGKMAPEIEGDDMEGHRLKLSDYRGKAVLLEFWAFW